MSPSEIERMRADLEEAGMPTVVEVTAHNEEDAEELTIMASDQTGAEGGMDKICGILAVTGWLNPRPDGRQLEFAYGFEFTEPDTDTRQTYVHLEDVKS
jgi:hypothetical protein